MTISYFTSGTLYDKVPRLVKSEPTELPAVEVNDMFMDRLFILEDGSYAIVDCIKALEDEDTVKQLAAGLVAFSDKEIGKSEKEDIGRMISMTTIGKMFYDHEVQTVREAELRIAKNLLEKGVSADIVASSTDLELSEVEGVQREIQSKVATA